MKNRENLKPVVFFEKWFGRHKSKHVYLAYYPSWEKPDFWIHENGARRRNGDNCFDFNLNFWRVHFSYTNFELQHNHRRESKC